MKKILLLVLALVPFACADNDINNGQPRSGEYLVFGDYYGMCAGNCVRMYLLNDHSLFEDSRKHYPTQPGTYEGNFSIDRGDKLEEVKDSLTQIPDALLRSDNIVLGCPDCSDGGGLYIETKVDGQIRYWFIDKQRVPAGLEGFVSLVNEKLLLLR